MSLNDVLGNGQSQASAPAFTRARRVHTIEALENPGLLSMRDSDTGIGNGHDYFPIFGAGPDYNLPPRRCVLDSIVEQVLEHLRQTVAIPEGRGNPFGTLDLQSQLLLPGTK